jgi:translation elongation factor EF-G
LDSLPEEQLRGITMKSSAISLLYKNGKPQELLSFGFIVVVVISCW